MSRRHGQPPTVLADRFSNWINPTPPTRQRAMSHGNVVYKEINPERSVNGRQPTAEIWSPNYIFHVKAQTAMMGPDHRVRLYECIEKHVSSSENPPPNMEFWREIISGHSNSHDIGHNSCNRRSTILDRPHSSRRDASKDSRRSSHSDRSSGRTGNHPHPSHVVAEQGRTLFLQDAGANPIIDARTTQRGCADAPQPSIPHGTPPSSHMQRNTLPESRFCR